MARAGDFETVSAQQGWMWEAGAAKLVPAIIGPAMSTRVAFAILIFLFPAWGYVWPLHALSKALVYADPPLPLFTEFLLKFLTVSDYLFIAAAGLLAMAAGAAYALGKQALVHLLPAAILINCAYCIYLLVIGSQGDLFRLRFGLILLLLQPVLVILSVVLRRSCDFGAARGITADGRL